MTRLEDDLDAKASWFGRRTVGQLVGLAVALVIGLSALGWAVSFISSWGSAATRIVSPANVSVQWTEGYQAIESLRATAGNSCSAVAAWKSETDPFQKTQRETQVLAFELNYRRIEADYDRRYENLWEGKIVKPANLPRRAPTFEQMTAKIC